MQYFISILLLICVNFASAATLPNHSELRDRVAEFIQTQTKDLPGEVSIQVEDLDSRLRLRPCPEMDLYMPAGAKLYGRTSVGVRCPGKDGWSVFVTAKIKVTANVLIANRPLQQGQILQAEDFSLQMSEITQPGVLSVPSAAVGRVIKYNIGVGQILRSEMFRAPFVVTQGQTVVLSLDGKGYRIRSEGQALNNAAEGEAVRVRTPSGQVVNGLARGDGSVEIRP